MRWLRRALKSWGIWYTARIFTRYYADDEMSVIDRLLFDWAFWAITDPDVIRHHPWYSTAVLTWRARTSRT